MKCRDFVPRDGAQRDGSIRAEKELLEPPVSVRRDLNPPLDAPIRHRVVAVGGECSQLGARNGLNKAACSVMDYGLSADGILELAAGVSVDKQLAQHGFVRTQSDLLIVG